MELRRRAALPLDEEQKAWLQTRFTLRPIRGVPQPPSAFAPWRAGEAPLSLFLRLDPTIREIGSENPEVQRAIPVVRREGQPKVIVVEDPDRRIFVLIGRHELRAYRELGGEDQAVAFLLGANRSGEPAATLYWARRIWHANEILSQLERSIAAFENGLEPGERVEFEGLSAVLARHVHFDLRRGSVDYGFANPLLTGISEEMNRLLATGLPFNQELCGNLAQGYEEIGAIHDDLNLVSGGPGRQRLALLAYELSNLWYRAAQHAYPGLFPVKAQLRIVNNMIRLGTLTRDRGILRRAIRELCVLLDTRAFTDEYLALVSRRKQLEPLTAEEDEDLAFGFLDTRRRFRSDVREAMTEAIRRFHDLVPEATKAAFRSLEHDLRAGRRGPTALFRFLRAHLTVLDELRYVEGGTDFALREGDRVRYMTLLEHVEEVAKGLEALETAARGFQFQQTASGLPPGAERQALERKARRLVLRGTRYFYGRLRPADREKIDLNAFVSLFADVVEDYRLFSTRNAVTRLNFWLGTILHDVGALLLEQHHAGGATLVRSLLAALELSPGRQESVLSYVLYHGEFKRYYYLEKSPRALLDFAYEREGLGTMPYLLFERRRVESIVDLAATGAGLLTTRFLEISGRHKSIEALERVAARLGLLRRAAWGVAATEELYEEQTTSEERTAFLDRYFAELRIVHCHNLRGTFSPRTHLSFHYLCARVAHLTGLPIDTVRLASDRAEHLEALDGLLRPHTVETLRDLLSRIDASARGLPPHERAAHLLRELRTGSGLILEIEDDHVLAVNTKLMHDVAQRAT
ncbi:MAG: hypothetical protein HZB55_23445 [Deltaproteobacteria bacterium]|nr:hypothetical protein [Deltaproteobacteria bacterium]